VGVSGIVAIETMQYRARLPRASSHLRDTGHSLSGMATQEVGMVT